MNMKLTIDVSQFTKVPFHGGSSGDLFVSKDDYEGGKVYLLQVFYAVYRSNEKGQKLEYIGTGEVFDTDLSSESGIMEINFLEKL